MKNFQLQRILLCRKANFIALLFQVLCLLSLTEPAIAAEDDCFCVVNCKTYAKWTNCKEVPTSKEVVCYDNNNKLKKIKMAGWKKIQNGEPGCKDCKKGIGVTTEILMRGVNNVCK